MATRVAVFVPSYCLEKNGTRLTMMSEESTRKGAEIARRRNAQFLILSTAYNTWEKEAQLKKEIALCMKVPEEIIVMIPGVTSTFDETQKLRNILEQESLTTLIAVADKWHMPRLKRLLKKWLPGLHIESYPFSTAHYDTMLEPSAIKRLRSSNGLLWAIWNIVFYMRLRISSK